MYQDKTELIKYIDHDDLKNILIDSLEVQNVKGVSLLVKNSDKLILRMLKDGPNILGSLYLRKYNQTNNVIAICAILDMIVVENLYPIVHCRKFIMHIGCVQVLLGTTTWVCRTQGKPL